MVADLEIERDDFLKNTDVIPVSDPHIFSETQRMAQMQAVLSRADSKPDLYEAKAVEERFLKQLKIPNVDELLKNVPAPEQRTLADENAAMAIGHTAYAYMQQDHIAHIQGHLMFGMDPSFGANPFIAPQFLPNAVEHIKQHMTLWYLNRMNGYVENLRGKPVDDYENPALTATIDKLYATVGQHVALDSEQVFAQIMPQLQQLTQIMQQNKPQPQLPPDAQVVKDTAMAETQRKAAKDQQDAQLAQAKLQDGQMRGQAEMQAKAQIAQAKQQGDQQRAQFDMQAKMQEIQASGDLQLQIAEINNQARIQIEQAKMAHESFNQPALMPPEGV
jgi:hypothetical protein